MDQETKRVGRKAGQGMNWCRLSTRMAIYARDHFCCVYCGAVAEQRGTGLTLDHITACEMGGTNKATNLVTACGSCNSGKCDLSLKAFLARLRKKGVDTAKISARVRRQAAKKLDRAMGLALATARKVK